MPQAPRLHITSCVHIFDSSYPIFCFCAANSKGGTNITILEYLRNYISLGSNVYDAPSKMSRTDGFCSLNWGIVVIMGSSCSSDLSPMLCFPVIFFSQSDRAWHPYDDAFSPDSSQSGQYSCYHEYCYCFPMGLPPAVFVFQFQRNGDATHDKLHAWDRHTVAQGFVTGGI